MNITKKIILIFLLLISSHSRGNENLLFKGDSLFDLKKYYEAKKYYDSLYFNEELYTNSMLLKLSLIENELGNFEKSIYYLSKYTKNDDNEIVDQNLNKLISENNLETYAKSDYSFLLSIYNDNKQNLVISFLIILFIIFCLNVIRRNRNQKMIFIKTFFILAFVTLLMINIKGGFDGIILNENTFVMNDPSSGSDVYKLIRKGGPIYANFYTSGILYIF